LARVSASTGALDTQFSALFFKKMDTAMDFGIGIAPSSSNQSQSGGPFTNNSEIVFGNGIFGATYQDQSAQSNPSAAASGYGAAVANPYAPNGALVPSSGETSMSTWLIVGAVVAGALAFWYLHKKGKI
jgi:LPXTG-motif cell wall-anchored protein